MTDQIVTNATPEPQAAQPTATTQDKTGGARTYTDTEVEQIVKDRLERATAKAKEAEAKAAERAAAETAAKQGEWKALAEQREKEAAELKARLDALELAARKRAIGAKFNLPEGLAERLTGTTDEELEADAKKLQALIPASPKPSPGPVNPGAGGSVKETYEQQRARIYGDAGGAMFDPDKARAAGGGVFFKTKE